MIVTVMKTTFQKVDPKILHYREYRKCNNYSFRQDFLSTLIMENINLSNGLQIMHFKNYKNVMISKNVYFRRN